MQAVIIDRGRGLATRARIEVLLAERHKNGGVKSRDDANGCLKEEDVSLHAAIIDRGRGPEIAGTRITVYDRIQALLAARRR